MADEHTQPKAPHRPSRALVPVEPAPRTLPSNFNSRYTSGVALNLGLAAILLTVGLISGGALVLTGLAEQTLVPILVAVPFGGIFGVIGAVFGWLGYRQVASARKVYRAGSTAVAAISGFRWSRSRRDDHAAAIYDFQFTVGGQTFKGEHESWQPLDLEAGDAVNVLYDPANPQRNLLYGADQYIVTDPARREELRRASHAGESHFPEHPPEHIQAPMDW